MEALLTCDAIVYNISDTATEVEEAMWAIQELHEKMSTFATVKVFVCISTVLTWAKTKPLNPVSCSNFPWVLLHSCTGTYIHLLSFRMNRMSLLLRKTIGGDEPIQTLRST